MQIEKDLFNIFMEYSEDKYEMNKHIIKYIDDKIKETKLKRNEETVSILTELINSINNARCEERRSEQIDFIRKNLYKLEYEEYELTH